MIIDNLLEYDHDECDNADEETNKEMCEPHFGVFDPFLSRSINPDE